MNYIEFYESKGIDLGKIKQIAMNKYRVSSDAVEEGAKRLYAKLVDGMPLKDISLVSRILAEAKPLSTGNTVVSPVVNYLDELTKRIERVENGQIVVGNKPLSGKKGRLSVIITRVNDINGRLGKIENRGALATVKSLSAGQSQLSFLVMHVDEIENRIERLEMRWYNKLSAFCLEDWKQFKIRYSWLFERVEI